MKTIICDIDGTLAHMVDRSPYDPTKYHTDYVDEAIVYIVQKYHADGFQIVICSGRDDTYMDVTEAWLQSNEVPYHEIFMRKAGDKRNDAIVKQEIWENDIRGSGRFDVFFVLDDRNRVVEMWREQGLKVLQVAEGDF